MKAKLNYGLYLQIFPSVLKQCITALFSFSLIPVSPFMYMSQAHPMSACVCSMFYLHLCIHAVKTHSCIMKNISEHRVDAVSLYSILLEGRNTNGFIPLSSGFLKFEQ